MHYDLCLICAKAEELRVVIETFRKSWKMVPGERTSDRIFEVPTPVGPKPVLVATCTGMGHLNAAVRTTQIISLYQPGVLMFVGTAASMRPTEVQVGDVVIPKKAISRIYEKISQKGQADYEDRIAGGNFKEIFFDDNALISDVETVSCSGDALGVIASVPIGDIKLNGVAPGAPLTIAGEQITLRNPKVADDLDIFSCGMVVDSTSYRTFLNAIAHANMRKAAVIDMESFGFFSAIAATRNIGAGSVCEGIMIRGVSDYAGRKQQSENLPVDLKRAAMENAAIVAQRFVQQLAAATEPPPAKTDAKSDQSPLGQEDPPAQNAP